nr:disrupted meiotic cDNA 1 protein [Ipomoea batatas]
MVGLLIYIGANGLKSIHLCPAMLAEKFNDESRSHLVSKKQKLAQMLSRLTKIAEEFNVAVYMTNQVIADPGGGVFISDPKKPAGGHNKLERPPYIVEEIKLGLPVDVKSGDVVLVQIYHE